MEETYPNALAAGTRIGAVVLERAIGQGAWGIVYEGRHDVHGRVAVKEYFPSTYASRQSRGSVGSSAPQWQEAVRRGLERFGNEGRTLRTIRHENVVAVHDYIEQGDVALLVMEYVEGVPLTDALAAGRFVQPADVMALGATLVDTLQALHAKNVLHRDIAPDNVMIRQDGSPVLIDFGGAGAAIASATRSSQNVVKDGYSPPEQYDTSATPSFPVGPWSDIYATAAVLYRVASGREPAVANARLLAAGMKNGHDPLQPIAASAPPGYPAHWLAGIDAGLALLPKDRPQSALEWRKRFEAPIKPPGPNKLLVGVAAGSSLVAAALAAFAIVPKFAPGGTPAPLARPSAPPIVARATAKPRPKHTTAPHVAAHATHPAGQGQEMAYRQQPVAQTTRIVYVTPPPVKHVDVPGGKGSSHEGRSSSSSRSSSSGSTAQTTVQPPQPTPEPTAPPTLDQTPVTAPAPPPAVTLASNPGLPPASNPGPALASNPQPPAASNPGPPPISTHQPTRTSTHQPPPVPTHQPTPAPTPGLTPPPTPAPIQTARSISTLECPSGYEYRLAGPSDKVCVTPERRAEVLTENSLAAARRSPSGGAYGPNTCRNGYVWRQAYDGDFVCVTPPQRAEAASENADAPAMISRPESL